LLALACLAGAASRALAESEDEFPLYSQPAPAAFNAESKMSLAEAASWLRLPWIHAEFFNWTTLKANAFDAQAGQATVRNYVGVNFRLGPEAAISIRQPFTYSYEFPKSDGAASDAHASDLYAEYQDAKLFGFWRDAKVAVISGRVNLPTGEDSRFITKTNGYFFGWLEATKPVAGNFYFNWHLRAQWYNQSQNLYVDANGVATGNKDWGVDQFPEAEYRFTPKVIATHATGTCQLRYRPGPGVPTRQDLALCSWSALNIQATRELAVTLALSDDADLNPAGRAFGIYRADETSYHLFLSASI
jgi:hypothetical protein